MGLPVERHEVALRHPEDVARRVAELKTARAGGAHFLHLPRRRRFPVQKLVDTSILTHDALVKSCQLFPVLSAARPIVPWDQNVLADARHRRGDGRVQSRLEDRGLDQRLRSRGRPLQVFFAGIRALRSQNGNAIF